MKVLVISHTYITKIGREKWRDLVREYHVDLKIIVPTIWKDYLFTIRYENHRDNELDIVPLPVFFSGKEAAHCYRSTFWMMHSFQPDILHVEEGTDALSYFQALTLKRILSPKARTLFFTWMNFEKKLKFPFSFFERYNFANSNAAICGNNDAKEILRAKGFTKPISVMPLLGIDPQLFSKRDQPDLRKKLDLRGVVIGFIGRFVEEKGVLDLIDAVSRIEEECTLLMIGGGTSESEMRRRAQELGIAHRLRIVLSIPHSEVPAHINVMDCLVLPSYTVPHWKEQFGQVLVQAMASEVAVLGSAHAEIPRVIGDAGLLFPERDTAALQALLHRLVRDSALRDTLALKGRARVLKHYTNTRIAEKTWETYVAVLRNSG